MTLLGYTWTDESVSTVAADDVDMMASWGCYLVRYFDDKGDIWWCFMPFMGNLQRAKGLQKPPVPGTMAPGTGTGLSKTSASASVEDSPSPLNRA